MGCRALGFVALATTALLSGCGTIANMQPGGWIAPTGTGDEETRVYGGVKDDTIAIRNWATAVANGEQDSAARLLVWSLDLPLSAIGDTLTLPYTMKHQPPAPGSDQPSTTPDTSRSATPTRGTPDR